MSMFVFLCSSYKLQWVKRGFAKSWFIIFVDFYLFALPKYKIVGGHHSAQVSILLNRKWVVLGCWSYEKTLFLAKW